MKEGDREWDDGYGVGSLNYVYYNLKKVEFRRLKVGSWVVLVCDFVERVVVWVFDVGFSDKKVYLLFDNYVFVEELGLVGDLFIIGIILVCCD